MSEKLVDEYLRADEAARSRYGERVLVFMQCGGFYEVYDVVDAETSKPLGVCERQLYLKVTPKRTDHRPIFMAGIPLDSVDRYRSMLVERHYTVLTIQQAESDASMRTLHCVDSPGFAEGEAASGIAVVLLAGTTAFVVRYDVQLNELRLFESADDARTVRAGLAELGGCVEIKVYMEETATDSLFAFEDTFSDIAVHTTRLEGKRRYLYDRSWQRRSLESFYARYSGLGEDLIGKIGLRDVAAPHVAALILLLGFVRDHDDTCIQTMPVPACSSLDRPVRLLGSAMSRLNILEAPRNGTTLFQHLGKHVRTPMGMRCLRARLCAPLNDVDALEKRLDEMEAAMAFIRAGDSMDGALKRLKDLTKLAHRIRRKRVHVRDVVDAVDNFRRARDIILLILTKHDDDDFLKQPTPVDGALSTPQNPPNINSATLQALQALETMLVDAGPLVDCELPFAEALAPLREDARDACQAVEAFQRGIDCKIGLNNATRLAQSGGVTRVTMSAARGRTLRDTGDYEVSIGKKDAYVEGWEIANLLRYMQIRQIEVDEEVTRLLDKLVDRLNDTFFFKHAEVIADWIGEIDMTRGLAQLSLLKGYCRPILDSQSETSAVELHALRHPILEELVDAHGHEYVRNDVTLSGQDSMLLYGVNSAGKSSLLKSVTIAVLMAQCGFFVAANAMKLAPYRHIAIHIGGVDDMFRAQSTFVHEVEELRGVLAASRVDGARTLFLADELGNSTEDTSALRLVAAMLHTLYLRQVTFVLATHMFALQNNEYIKGLRGLRNYHLKVDFDKGIVFERTLQPGLPATRDYGCRIAAKLLVDDNEMVRAMTSDWHNHQERFMVGSRYNRHVFAEACCVCSYRPTATHHKPVAWHHIREQCTAIDGLLPDNRPLHASSNLVPVCDECHNAIHRGHVDIVGYEETVDGRRLIIHDHRTSA